MATVELKAHELTDTDVNFVSLVKRGANRIPFRIVKGDAEMIDLAKIGRKLFNKSEAGVSIVAVIAQKSDELAQSRAKIIAKACGFEKAALAKSDDGIVQLTKEGVTADKAVLVKLDRNFAVAVTGSNVVAAMKNHDFSDTIYRGLDGSQGFVVGPTAAHRMFKGATDALVAGASSPSALATDLTKAASDFTAYSEALGIGLPADLMKADHLVKDWDDDADEDGTGGNSNDTGDANGKAGMKKASTLGDKLTDEGDPGAKDPLMPPADAVKKAEEAKAAEIAKADAGKNGTGAGVEGGKGTGTNPAATTDDKSNTEINAKPGGKVSGNDSGMPSKVMAQKLDALTAVAKSMGLDVTVTKGEGGSHIINVRTIEIPGESAAGEGAAQGVDKRPENNATGDDKNAAGGDIAGKVKGNTLDMDGVPAGLRAKKDDKVGDDASTNGVQDELDEKLRAKKNDGDAEIGKKGTGNVLDDSLSGAGAQETNVQSLKGDGAGVMQAIAALAKSVKESHAAVTKSVADLGARVDSVSVLAKKHDAALHGTVLGEAGDDRTAARKSERDSAPPLLDTGFSRRM